MNPQFTLTIFLTLASYFNHLSAQPDPHHFKIQYIGSTRYVTPEEERNRNICENYWCVNDANYLFTKSSQYLGVDPCDDFKNFTVNKVDEVDQINERDINRGFQSFAFDIYFERLRKVVAAKIDPVKDNRIVKVMKNTFRKCVDSPHTFRNLQAHKDIIEHLTALGGSPYLSKHIHFNPNKFNATADYAFYPLPNDVSDEDALWDGKEFELKKLFETEPEHAFSLFLDMEVTRCEDQHQQNRILCLAKTSNPFRYRSDENFLFEIYKELFNNLEDSYRIQPVYKKLLIEEVYNPVIHRMNQYLKSRNEKLNPTSPKIKISIKDLRDKFAMINFDIDWLRIINSQLLTESKVTENDEILIIAGIEMLEAVVKNMIDTDRKILADAFLITFLYINRHALILHFYNHQTLTEIGLKKSYQRWQVCILQLDDLLYPAHLAMYEQQRSIWDRTLGDFDRETVHLDIPDSAEKFIQEAVIESKKRFIEGTNLKPSIAIEVLNKLKTLTIVVSLQSKFFPITKLEEFYADLNLNGDEKFLESMWVMKKNHRKILNEPPESGRRQIDRMVFAYRQDIITYDMVDGNILYIPTPLLIYPTYHPRRPRFFNMATLFMEIIGRIDLGIKTYVAKKFKIQPYDFKTSVDNNVKISYNHYINWLKTNTDLIIGANYLTLPQLYWVALAVSNYDKFHKTVPKHVNRINRLRQEYYHVYFKQLKGFQEAFQCNITDEELIKFDELTQKIMELL